VTSFLSGQFVICRLGLAIINPQTKLEVSLFPTMKMWKVTN